MTTAEEAVRAAWEQQSRAMVAGEVATLTSVANVTVTIGGSRGTWPMRSTVRYEQRAGAWRAVRSSSTLA